MVANILPAAPTPSSPNLGVKMSNLTFAEHGHVAYQIKGNCECNNMVANILSAAPPPPLPSEGQKSTFSEDGHVAYQIKGNRECSNMVANILPIAPLTWPWGQKVKFNFCRTWSCCISNLRESRMQHYGNIYIVTQPPPPLSPQKVKIQLFQNMVMLHIKGSRMQQHGSNCRQRYNKIWNILNVILDGRPVPNPLGGLRWWDQNVKIHFFRTWSCCISN